MNLKLFKYTYFGEINKISFRPSILLLFLVFHTSFYATIGETAVVSERKTHSQMMQDYMQYKVPYNFTKNEMECLQQKDDLTPRSGLKCIRKECRTLTTEERVRLFNAIRKMKTDPDPQMGTTKYDLFIMQHRSATAPGAHGGPCFLVYHRMLLYKFELALREIDPLVSLCYWDSTLDSYMPNAAHSIMWTPDYLGPSYGEVNEGVCSQWKIVPGECQASGTTLKREMLGDPALMMNTNKINQFFNKKSFADAVSPKNTYFEDCHGDIHISLGGHMNDLMCSPNDLVFYFHHCFIDLLFAQFQSSHPNSPYPNSNIEYNRPMDPLYPWYDYTIVDVYNNKNFTTKYYEYEQRPGSCLKDTHCCPPHGGLYCNYNKEICMAKVRKGGECNGLDDAACYCDKPGQTGACQNGFCQCITGCQADSDCKTGQWCDLLRYRCTPQAALESKCHTSDLPNSACYGICPQPSQPLCYEYKCQCVELVYN